MKRRKSKESNGESDRYDNPEVVQVENSEGRNLAEDVSNLNLQDSSSTYEPASTGELVKYDPLQRYMSEIKQWPILTRDEEERLAIKFHESGDRDAAYKLIVSNLRLVVFIAQEYQRHWRNILDLIQEGNIGLMEAVKKFDPYRGIRFPSYAVYWIRAYMLRYLINNIRLVKIGTTQAQRKLFFNLRKEREKLEAEGFVPEARLLADRLNVKESEVVEMEQRLALPDLSVDAPLAGSDGEINMHGILPDSRANVEEQVVEQQFSQAIRQAVEEFKKNLDEREKAIVDRRLFTEDPATLQDIADEFGLSRERIRQLESRIKKNLKKYLADKLQLDEGGQVEIGWASED